MAATTLALGYNSKITLDSGNDGLFTTSADLGGWVSGSLTIRRTNPDSTRVDTAGFEGKEYGIRGASLTLEIMDDQAGDTDGQDQLITDYFGGTKRWIRVQPRVGTGYLEWTAQWVINNAAWTLEQNGLVRFSLGADTDGTITKADQA